MIMRIFDLILNGFQKPTKLLAQRSPSHDPIAQSGMKQEREVMAASAEAGKKKVLYARAWTASGDFVWYRLDLADRCKSNTPSLMQWDWPSPSRKDRRALPRIVTSGSVIYAIGGIGHTDDIHMRYHGVYFLDTRLCNNEWRKDKSTPVQLFLPTAAAVHGKLCIFSGANFMSEIFVSTSIRKRSRHSLLPSPPDTDIDLTLISDPVLPDASNGRIIVHFSVINSLYAFYVDKLEWVCIDQNFDYWYSTSVVVDDVLYCYSECYGVLAYDLVKKKWLNTKDFPSLFWDEFVDLGDGKLCMICRDRVEDGTHVMCCVITIQKEGTDVVHAIERPDYTFLFDETRVSTFVSLDG